ncbi:kinetochore protein ndc80-like [Polistes fuscatus]|uniref:kinetochore protein ndc80-like n=1 Tax=Polistes fuscatus TaxID=30207 RepID=UPI001CA8E8AF|nr:kinetochore protein ndc80-like [Polistes fuscatus]
MQNNSTRRRSSSNPRRISTVDKGDKSLIKNDSKKTFTLKSKSSFSASDVSHIPRPRMRSSSCDPGNNRLSNLKSTGKSTLHLPTTPATPSNNNNRRLNAMGLSTGLSTGLATGLATGRRTPSKDHASNIGTKGARKDTRVLLDKNYQVQMLNKIDTYIQQIQCSSMLNSNGSLKPITLKMFVEVSDLLVKLIDPKQTLTLANYIEQLPKIAKKLHYPGMISKSLLKTANTPHSWPYVLGWLSWLVEVCQVKDLAYNSFQLDNLPFIGTEQQMKDNRNSFFFMLSIYGAWNDEKLDEEATLINEYLQDIEKQYGVTENDLVEAYASLDKEQLSLQETEQKLKDVDVEVQKLKDILMSLEEDAAKQTKDVKAQEEYIKNLNTEKEQFQIQNKYLYEKIQIQNKQYKELLSVVKEQPMSRREKEDIVNKCSGIQNYIQQFDDHLKEMQKDIYKLDIKIASVNSNLYKIVLGYNQEIFKHFGSDNNIDVEELKMPEKDMLDPNIMDNLNSIDNFKNELKDGWIKNVTKWESYIETYTNKLELLQRQMKALEENNVILHNKLKDKKAHINNWKNEENTLREQIQIFQNEMQSYQEMIPNLEGITSKLEEFKEKLDAVKRRKLYIEQNGKRFFEKLYEILGEHRNELNRTLKID